MQHSLNQPRLRPNKPLGQDTFLNTAKIHRRLNSPRDQEQCVGTCMRQYRKTATPKIKQKRRRCKTTWQPSLALPTPVQSGSGSKGLFSVPIHQNTPGEQFESISQWFNDGNKEIAQSFGAWQL